MSGGAIIKCLITCCAYTPLFILLNGLYSSVLVYIILLATNLKQTLQVKFELHNKNATQKVK
jgi:hypothetical protein